MLKKEKELEHSRQFCAKSISEDVKICKGEHTLQLDSTLKIEVISFLLHISRIQTS